MIEAVNSVVANASVLRGSAEQASAARSFASNPQKVQEVIQAPYVSPFISLDLNYDKAVLQIRDSETGDVLKQFPSETALEYRSRQAARQATQTFEIPEIDEGSVSDSGQAGSSGGNIAVSTPQPVNAQAQVAAAALASTAAQAQAVAAPPTSGNVVVTA